MTHRTRHTAATMLTLAAMLGASVPISAQSGAPTTALGSFGPAASLVEARIGHTATLLPDGRVLIVGGDADGTRRASTELWDPVTGSFGPAGSLKTARSGHTATYLSEADLCPRCPPGRVLVIGGHADDVLPSAELLDLPTGSSLPGGTLATARQGHTATLLASGQVFVVGGYDDDDLLASAEMWDPVLGTFGPSGSLTTARSGHTATLLPDGAVLIIGGQDENGAVASAELWDPVSGAFGPAGSLAGGRTGHTATLLPDGRVLVVGGGAFTADGFTILASAELWEPDAQPAPAPSGSDAQQTPAPSGADELDRALAAVELLNMPPAGIMETCQPGSPTLDGQLAAIQCSFGADTVVYASFDDVSSLRAAYESLTGSAGVEGGTSCRDGAFEGSYPAADGTEAGRMVCQTSADGPLMAWTDDRNVVLGFLLLAGDGGFAGLHDHWLKVRLDAAPSDGPSPSAASATAEPVGPGGKIRQWAASATASSQYLEDDWSAQQATGSPDTADYGDHPSAWAPSNSDAGVEWLELTYPRSVVPTAVSVWETSGAGAVTMIEALPDGSATWMTLWKGTDPSPDARTTFSPPLVDTPIFTKRLRLTIDTEVPGWNEIDAVELVGIAGP